MLKKSFTKSNESRRLELKKKINEMIFRKEQEINIFVIDLQNTIEEQEKINEDLNKNTKVGILNNFIKFNIERHTIFIFQ